MARRKHKDPNDPARLARIAARREIDEALIRHWPGLVEKEDDGWVMRFSKAYTRWANAVFPMEAGRYPIQNKIEIVEPLYVQQKQRPLFRLTIYTQPEDLDKYLADNGYARVGRTSVLTYDLTAPAHDGDVELLDAHADRLVLGNDLHEGDNGHPSWLDATNAWLAYGIDTKMPPARPDVLKNFLYDTHYAMHLHDGKPAAAAVFVADADEKQGFITNLMVDPAFNKTDEIGQRVALVRELIRKARAAGLHRLIVEADMEKDDLHEHLTARLGLEERYRYWYRAKMFF